MVRQRLIRSDPPLPDEAVLVRSLFEERRDGTTYDRDTLIADAIVNFDAFGYYGLSLWGIADGWPLEAVLKGKARKARRVALYTAGELRAQRLELLPSGRTPHFDTTVKELDTTWNEAMVQSAGSLRVFGPGAEELVARFLGAAYTVVENFYFVATRTDRGD